MNPRTPSLCLASLLIISACSGGGSEETSEQAVDGADTDAAGDENSADLPFSGSGFDVTCATQVPFADTAAYDGAAAEAHPTVLLQKLDDNNGYSRNFAELPEGWIVEDDDDFDDNSELSAVQLVSCLLAVDEIETGVICELELDDGSVAELEVVEVFYDLNIYEAQTATLVGTEQIAAAGTDCPSFVFVDEGQTQYRNSVDGDQLTLALADYVAPGGLVVDPAELPPTDSGYSRLCDAQVGFGGAASYVEGPGPHPVILLQQSDSGLFSETGSDLPEAWIDTDVAAIELVACSAIAETVDSGFDCSLEADDGDISTLDLLVPTYELTVYEAATGAVVSTASIEVSTPDCPFIALVDEGQTELLATPSTDDYAVVLQSVVEPA